MPLEIKVTVGKVELSVFPVLTPKQRAFVGTMHTTWGFRYWSSLSRSEKAMAKRLLTLSPCPIKKSANTVSITETGIKSLESEPIEREICPRCEKTRLHRGALYCEHCLIEIRSGRP